MKRIFLSLLPILMLLTSHSQPIVNRAGPANSVQDANLFAQRSFRVPVYSDTTQANSLYTHLDSCGLLIFTYSDNLVWQRSCSPKRWVPTGARFGLEDVLGTSNRAFNAGGYNFSYTNGNWGLRSTNPTQTLSIGSNAGTETGVLYTPDGTVLKLETKNNASMELGAGSQISFQPALNTGGQVVMDGSVSNYVSNTYYTNGGGLLAKQGIGSYSVPNQESEFYLRTFNYYDPVILDSQYTYLTLYNKMKFINIPNDDTTAKIITIDGANNVRYRNASTISGGSGGIHGVYAGYGLTKVNDSTLKADTTVGTGLIGYLRYIKLKDSIASVYTPMARTLSNGYGISSIGDLSANRTVSADTTVGVGLIGWPRFIKLKDSISAIYQVKGNYITALTGDVTASGPGSVAATLATVNSNVGSFTNASITVNGKGLITAASSGSVGSAFTFNDSLKWNDSRAYGLVGDGTTDNITAMRAMRQAAASNGWPIVFAPGIYYASDSVTFYKMTLIGHNATIKTTSTTVTIFNLADSNEVYGFKFIGTGIAAALPGGVFTTQDGMRIFGNKNRVHDNWFTSLNGSGINIWAGSCCGYRNLVYGNTFISNTIGIFAMTNSEYLDAFGNKGEFNFVGIYDRSSSNNRWSNNEFSYSINSNFRLLGNGDHGGAWNNTFNHGNTYNVLIESCTLNYDFGNNICYTGNIGFGTVDTVHNFNWHGGTISGATITGSKVEEVVIQEFTEGSTANTYSTTGVVYKNAINNTAIPDVVNGALAGSFVTLKSTMGAGTATGVAVSMVGGTNGGTTLWQIANNGNIGSGFAPTSGFKQIIKSLGTGSGTVHTLWRNASDQALLQISDLGDVRMGNQSLTTSVNNLYNKNFVGGALGTTPTAWLHLAPGTSGIQTAPLKFTAGTNLATTEAGAVEFDGTHLYFTAANAGTRYQLDQQAGTGVSSVTGTANQVLANGTSGSAQTGAVTLTTPQDIATTSTVQFGGIGIGASAGGPASNSTINPSVTPSVGSNGTVLKVQGTLVENGSGTHAQLASLVITAPTITGGAATVTRTASLNITGAPSATVTDNNYAIIVDAGWSQFSGFGAKITSTSTDITLGDHHTVTVDASGANRTITLPPCATNIGRIYVILKSDASANTTTIDGNASETISGSTTKVISSQYSGYMIQATATEWFIISTF